MKRVLKKRSKVNIVNAANVDEVCAMAHGEIDACSSEGNWELVSFEMSFNGLEHYVLTYVKGLVRFFVKDDKVRYEMHPTKDYETAIPVMIQNSIAIMFRAVSKLCDEYAEAMESEIAAYIRSYYSPCYTTIGYTTFSVLGKSFDYQWLTNYKVIMGSSGQDIVL
ncbi:MAG: hypothetical protein EOM77_03680 [Bacteroidia bacterium]|nr:hypothetical protein [Bacteroidia bacterium]